MSIIETLSQKSIRQYIEGNNNPGALLVSGEWGCGKTYFLKKLAKEYNDTNDYAIIVVSLFGLTSSEEIEEKVKKELCYAMATKNSDEDTKDTTSKLYNGFKTLTEIFKDSSKMVKAVDTIININYLDFIDLAPEMKDKKIVIIFDDFERCTIDSKILLGIINEYSENIGLKVILVANIVFLRNDNNQSEDESDESEKAKEYSKFKMFKEKVIYKNIKLEQNCNEIINQFIDEYKGGNDNYKFFLQQNVDIIGEFFSSSSNTNYRSIKVIINDFEKIYILCEKLKDERENEFSMPQKNAILLLFKQFILLTIESRNGKEIYHDLVEVLNNQEEYVDASIPDYWYDLSKGICGYIPEPIIDWIDRGIYNEELIKKYIQLYIEKYTPQKKSASDIFLSNDIFTLDETQLNDGYMEAIERAYSGELISEEYLTLLRQIHKLNSYKVLPLYDFNYDKIKKGFESKERISEDYSPFQCIDQNVDEEAKDLYELIKSSIENKSELRMKDEYLKLCMDSFNNNDFSKLPVSNFYDRITIDFSEELMNAIYNSFKIGKNKDRKIISDFFLKMKIDTSKNKENADTLKEKLDKLLVSPENQNVKLDIIGKANIKKFKDNIDAKFSESTTNQ